MIAALLLVVCAQAAPEDALHLDPRTLPHAQEGRWKDFDPARLRPEDLPPGMLAVQGALQSQDFPRALAGLQAALRSTPDFPSAWHQLGVLYFRLQRYGDGAACLERYLALAPQRVGDTRVLGHCYYSLGDYARARTHYERVLAVHPDEVEALRGHALARLRLGDPPGALAELERVIELAPRHAEAWEWKAQILFDSEQMEPALAAALHAREIDPFSARAWFLCSRACAELGRDAESQTAQRRFQELNAVAGDLRQVDNELLTRPRDVKLLERRAALHARSGDRARTREDLARLYAVEPESLELRLRALDLLSALGDFEAARVVAHDLERLGAQDPATWKRLEQFYARAKDRAKVLEAAEHYQRLTAK